MKNTMNKKYLFLLVVLLIYLSCDKSNKDYNKIPWDKYPGVEIRKDPIPTGRQGPSDRALKGNGCFKAGLSSKEEEVRFLSIEQKHIDLPRPKLDQVKLPDGTIKEIVEKKCLLILIAKDGVLFSTYIDSISITLSDIVGLFKKLDEQKSSDDYFKITIEILGKKNIFDELTLKFLSSY